MPLRINQKKTLLAAGAVALWLLFMIVGDGLAMLLTLIGSGAALVSVPVLWLIGRGRVAATLLAGFGIFWGIYVVTSTGVALVKSRSEDAPLAVGQEVCADSGCFAVDKVDRANGGPVTEVTLLWHISSTDKEITKRFPGKGLEIYMFDELGRKFALPSTVNSNPLDVTIPAGETVHQSLTFQVPTDAHHLFLTAKYRPYTFQSLFPGELSLVQHRHLRMIQIQ